MCPTHSCLCVLYTDIQCSLWAYIQSTSTHTTKAHPECIGQVGVWHHPIFIAYSNYNFSLVGSSPGIGVKFSGLSFSVYSSTEILSRSWASLSFSQSKFATKNFRKCCSCKNLSWVAKVNTLISSKAKPNYTYTC